MKSLSHPPTQAGHGQTYRWDRTDLDPDAIPSQLFELAFFPVKKENCPCCILGPMTSLVHWIPSTPSQRF